MTDLQQQIVDYLNDAPAVTHRGLVHFTREPAAAIAEAVDGLVLDGVVVVRDGRIRLRPVAVEVVDEPAPEPLPAPRLPVEPPPPPVPPEEPPAPSAASEIEAVRLSMRLRVLEVVTRSPWLSSHQIAKLVGARRTAGVVSGALNTLWNAKAITRVGAPARVAGGGYRYALPGTPVPADLAVAELPAKAPQVVVAGSNRHQTLELLAEHPWRSLGQIREALGGVKGVSAILATMHGDGSVVRIKTADGYRYALPGTPELIGVAELLTAPPPIAPEVGLWVDREPPALPGVLEMDRLRAEIAERGRQIEALVAYQDKLNAEALASIDGARADRDEARAEAARLRELTVFQALALQEAAGHVVERDREIARLHAERAAALAALGFEFAPAPASSPGLTSGAGAGALEVPHV